MIQITTDMAETGFIDAINVIKIIKQKYGHDLGCYDLTFLRNAFDKPILRHNIKFADLLILRMLEDENFFDLFLQELLEVSSELFRDPDTWVSLIRNYLPEIFNNFEVPRFWFPGTVNGQDFLSLLIILHTLYNDKNYTIEVSSASYNILTNIQRRQISQKELESSLDNFEKVFPHEDLNLFFTNNGKELLYSPFIRNKLVFSKSNLMMSPVPEKISLIFLRNKLLMYRKEFHMQLLENLTAGLEEKGLLITGIMENIEDYLEQNKYFKYADKSEKIYIKMKNQI
jgi:chemotaxis methyl-accepting protein methylase